MIKKRLLCNKKIIAHRITYCDNILSQATGLMFRSKNSVDDIAWWFRFKHSRNISVTMFFVFFPIDIVFLRDGRIVEIKQDLRPFTNYTPEKKIDGFIELKQGAVRKYSLKIGSRISSS